MKTREQIRQRVDFLLAVLDEDLQEITRQRIGAKIEALEWVLGLEE